MNRIGYYLGIAGLALGIGGCASEPKKVLPEVTQISYGQINERYVSYSMAEIFEGVYRCDLKFHRTLDHPEVILMDHDCNGDYDMMQLGEEHPLYFAQGEFNPETLAEFNRMMKMAKDGEIPKYTTVPKEVKDANSKTVAQIIGIPSQIVGIPLEKVIR